MEFLLFIVVVVAIIIFRKSFYSTAEGIEESSKRWAEDRLFEAQISREESVMEYKQDMMKLHGVDNWNDVPKATNHSDVRKLLGLEK